MCRGREGDPTTNQRRQERASLAKPMKIFLTLKARLSGGHGSPSGGLRASCSTLQQELERLGTLALGKLLYLFV